MRKIFILLGIFNLFTLSLFAQTAHFVTEGEIEFERTINMYAVLKKSIDSANTLRMDAFQEYKKSQPQFLVLKSTLAFTKTQTSYIPTPSGLLPGVSYFGDNPWFTQINTVYQSMSADSATVQKNVNDQLFLVQDKKLPIKWKITDETREIAGYACRRANGLVNDSIYVVAFYTNKIPIPGGPESFHGLPGMILGLAIPYENVTWFATAVTERKNALSLFNPPSKGKIVNKNELKGMMEVALKSRGAFSESILLGYML